MSDRMSVRRILAPTDFSECATGAVEYAKVLARRFRSGITLLHVAPIRATFEPLPLTGMSFVEPFADEQERAASALAAYRADLLADFPESDGVLVTGTPAEAILTTSRSVDADIIVMGTHGREGLRRAFLGSVAESVIQRSDKPVLTVRSIADRRRPSGIARILCPVNYSEVASRAFQHALLLASAFEAELTVLYLEEEGEVDHSAEMHRLREWVSDVPLTMRATLLVDHGEAAAQVNDYALRHEIDLIVMGVQHKRRDTITVIGTTTATLTRHAPCPVLTIPGDLLVIEEREREHTSPRDESLAAPAAAARY
jgi:nucleotide-binding universal stress UspA family protein